MVRCHEGCDVTSAVGAPVPDLAGMRRCLTSIVLTVILGFVVAMGAVGTAGPVAAQEVDTEFPPGNPVLGDDRPGDIQGGDETNYALWVLGAVCLIAAGVLLIKIERWEARRIEHNAPRTGV